ncbi:MAG: 3'-5' exonuclease [Candidatus Fermentibacteraceae bacterium]|nr:3'-5' exonuclease [Candidatus Fermentibacteraceae bacterium]MBN2609318.1 3'-5' exonuclease [Candidatus Fermentibacteraceae bacterium]
MKALDGITCSGSSFLAIDFETADEQKNSACAIGLVKVVNERIREKVFRLIRPPRNSFRYTHIHGISWEDVQDQPLFTDVWREIEHVFVDVKLMVAHNASFDRAVLRRCLETAGLRVSIPPFECTMILARRLWRIHPTSLPAVCRHLGIELRHHHPLSDAEASARIMMAALKTFRKRRKGS